MTCTPAHVVPFASWPQQPSRDPSHLALMRSVDVPPLPPTTPTHTHSNSRRCFPLLRRSWAARGSALTRTFLRSSSQKLQRATLERPLALGKGRVLVAGERGCGSDSKPLKTCATTPKRSAPAFSHRHRHGAVCHWVLQTSHGYSRACKRGKRDRLQRL